MGQSASPRAQNGLKILVWASAMVHDHFWRKRVFDPFVDPFLVPKWPIFQAFWGFPWAKTRHRGLKAGEKTCLSIPNGPRSLLQKHPFDPNLTHFWSQNIPFARNFGVLCGSQCVTTGSKWAKNTCWGIPNGLAALLGKYVSTHFQPIFGPKTTHFQAILAFSKAQNVSPRMGSNASKRTKNTCWSIPNGPRSVLGNCFFDPFLVPRWPIFKAFWGFSMGSNASPRAQSGRKNLFEHPKWSTITFSKTHF